MRAQILIILVLSYTFKSYSQNFPYKLSRAHISGPAQGPNYPCEAEVKVADNRPNNCVFDNNFYMYPVFVENFDSKEGLPNNWRFDMGYSSTDDVGSGMNGLSYLGNAYSNNNIYTENGFGYLEWKKEQVLNVKPKWDATDAEKQDFDFTGAFLKSFFELRQGVFEARIKLPEHPYFWPAYWIYNVQEIDVFEFYDKDITSSNICDTYHSMQMTLHGRISKTNLNLVNVDMPKGTDHHCTRSRRFPVPNNFFDNYHTYKCVWTDYRIDIYLDGTLVGYTSKYYDGPFFPSDGCQHDAGAWLPASHRNCYYMANAQECNMRVKVPNFPDVWNWHYECWVYNKVKKDMTFPSTSKPMNLIISNSFARFIDPSVPNNPNNGAISDLKNSWGNFGQDDKRIGIDWIKIYQPVDCNSNKYICSISDFKSNTGNTNFLSGSIIQMGNASNCFIQNKSNDNFPMHVLATNEIRFLGDMIFEEGTHLRAEIIDCNGGFNEFQRTTQTGEKLYLTDEEIAEIENKQNDSLMLINSSFRDSILAYNQLMEQYKALDIKSDVDNGAITLFPNPTDKYLQVGMAEEDFYDLYEIEIFDNMGRNYPIEKSNMIDVAFLSSGFYQIKFKFSHGYVVVKNFVKK